MKRNKKYLVWLVLILTALLAACGGQATPAPKADTGDTAAEKPASTEPVKLLLWATGSDDEAKVLATAAKLYNKNHPNVTIDVQAVSWDDAHAKMLTAATSKSGPDIITGGLSWGIEFGELGGMVNLNDYPNVIGEVKKVAHPQVMASVTSPSGDIYGVPWDLTVFLTYYSPDTLKEAGAAVPPTTWDEMTAAIKAMQAKGKKGFAMQWGNTQWLQYFNYLYQAGGTLYDEKCTQATINSPEGVKALEFYASLYKEYKTSTEGWPDMEGGLESGDLGFASSGSWIAGSLNSARPKLEGKWTLSTLPAGPTGKHTAFIGGRIMGIMSFSKAPDVAADFIGSIYTAETVDAMVATSSELHLFYIPPRIDFTEKMKAPEDWKKAVKAQLEDAVGPPNCKGWEESARTVEAQLQEVIFKDGDPKTALDTAAKTMNDLLK